MPKTRWVSLALCLVTSVVALGCSRTQKAPATNPNQLRADQFLALVNPMYQALSTVESVAQWDAQTDVTAEHDAAASAAAKAKAAFNGNPALITEARELLTNVGELDTLTVRQLRRVLLNAAEGPMTNPDLVSARIDAETAQSSTLNSFTFRLAGRPITANEIDEELVTQKDLRKRLAVWETSKQSGPALKPGLVKLQELRNGVARELGYPDYFTLQVAKFDMTTEEMLKLNEGFMDDLRPLYRQIHTWARYELAERYRQPVPTRIPAHWITNRWSQSWEEMLPAPTDASTFDGKTPEWITRTAESFYTGIGFPPLPATFWERSDLYPVAATDKRKKNTHASCWHMDLETDIRSLMSIAPDMTWFTTAHHELGHAYYDMSYSRPEVPYVLRSGANPAFHEGMGELIGLASHQTPYLKTLGLLSADAKADSTQDLLRDALDSIPFLFFSSGVMTHWEADLYVESLPPDQWNARWWKYVADFQGVDPPTPRGEEFCDPATKTHIDDTPAYYYSYAIATVLKFQLHDHIAMEILHQDPRQCSYAGNKEVGDFLRGIMSKGATSDWRTVLREATGEDLSTRAMAEYFRPLMAWLEAQNQGRPIGWEESGASAGAPN